MARSAAAAAGVCLAGGAPAFGRSRGAARTGAAPLAAMPAINPFLAQSQSNQSHWNDAATDATLAPAPRGHFRLTPRSLQIVPNDALGIPNYSAVVRGREVHWFFSGAALRKLHRTSRGFTEIDRAPITQTLPGYAPVSGAARLAQARAIEALLRQADEDGLLAYLQSQPNRLASAVEDQVAEGVLYSLFTREHAFIGANARGLVRIDNANPEDPFSRLQAPLQVRLPDSLFDDGKVSKKTIFATDSVFGLSMSFNGYLVVNTVGGKIITLDRTTLEVRDVYEAGGEEVFTNSFATSEEAQGGAVYVASNQTMYRLVVDSAGIIHDDAGAGAWSAAYDAGERLAAGKISDGTGATPTLMGFGPGEDRLVVLTDGARQMRLVAFWRDAIPTDWRPDPSFASPRIADQIRVDLGPEFPIVQSEQSVVVYGQHAFVINGIQPPGARPLRTRHAYYRGLLAGTTRPLPRGAAMFVWSTQERRWRSLWTRTDIATIATVPFISGTSRMVVAAGAFDDRLNDFYHVGLDIDTGALILSISTGADPVFNAAFTGIRCDEKGTLLYTTMFGLIRLDVSRMARTRAPRR